MCVMSGDMKTSNLVRLVDRHRWSKLINISQGSVATRLGCGGIFNHDYYKFTAESEAEEISKIGQNFTKMTNDPVYVSPCRPRLVWIKF